MNKAIIIALIKILISIVALAYIGYFILGLFQDYLGSNPVEVVTHKTGEWGLYFLFAALAVTPLRRHFQWNSLQRFRRFLGLWSFTFIFLHFFTFILFDHFFDWWSIVEDIIERPYITVGFAAFIFMLPLAVTSLQYFQRMMGKRWLMLHRSVYVVGILGIIHYLWLVKADILEPLIYGLVLVVLLGDRVYWIMKKRVR
ncbi:MAG: sulfite oxidase heme-binding subunit YedZ [Cellvibrionaceae bacterium]